MASKELIATKPSIIPAPGNQVTSHFVEYPIMVSPKVLGGFVNQALPILTLASKEGANPFEDSITITIWGFQTESTMRPISFWIDQPLVAHREASSPTAESEVAGSELKAVFEELLKRWKAQTLILSSATQIVMNESYQKIIGLGPKVLPLIFNELKREPDLWFWALRAITRQDPVPLEHSGKLKKMTADWLAWASDQGYVD